MKISNSKDIQYLVQLGLTKQEANVYLTLWNEGAMTAEQLAVKLFCLPQAASRSAKKLEKNNLIGTIRSFPHTYQAIAPSIALPMLAKTKASLFQTTADALAQTLSHDIPRLDTTMNLIIGSKESYMYGAKLLNETKKEMLVISIGENLPEELLLSVRKARERGVVIHMITQQYGKENKEVLEHLKKNGYEIRHAPSKGFHLAIYDGKESLLIVRNAEKPDERASVHIVSAGLSETLRDYFYKTWKSALPV